MIRIMIRNIEKKRYLRVAWALWMVTWSSVASRLGRPRSKYLISNSRNGLISWDENEEMTDALYRLNTESNSNSNRINHLILDEFPNNSSHFITCIHSFIRYNIKFILLINKYNLTRIEGRMNESDNQYWSEKSARLTVHFNDGIGHLDLLEFHFSASLSHSAFSAAVCHDDDDDDDDYDYAMTDIRLLVHLPMGNRTIIKIRWNRTEK